MTHKIISLDLSQTETNWPFPVEITGAIFQYLSPSQLATLAKVCKQFRTTVYSERFQKAFANQFFGSQNQAIKIIPEYSELEGLAGLKEIHFALKNLFWSFGMTYTIKQTDEKGTVHKTKAVILTSWGLKTLFNLSGESNNTLKNKFKEICEKHASLRTDGDPMRTECNFKEAILVEIDFYQLLALLTEIVSIFPQLTNRIRLPYGSDASIISKKIKYNGIYNHKGAITGINSFLTGDPNVQDSLKYPPTTGSLSLDQLISYANDDKILLFTIEIQDQMISGAVPSFSYEDTCVVFQGIFTEKTFACP